MAPERTIDFLLTYVLIVVTAWRLLYSPRYLPALVVSSLAILRLLVAGFQSLWYALATAAAFALVMAARQRFVSSRLYVREEAD